MRITRDDQRKAISVDVPREFKGKVLLDVDGKIMEVEAGKELSIPELHPDSNIGIGWCNE